MYTYYKKIESNNHYLYEKEIITYIIKSIQLICNNPKVIKMIDYDMELIDIKGNNVKNYVIKLLSKDNDALYYQNSFHAFKRVYDMNKYIEDINKTIQAKFTESMNSLKEDNDWFVVKYTKKAVSKKKYRVGVQYSVYGYIDVEASSEEEAFAIANDENNDYGLNDVNAPEYLTGSWMADRESVEELIKTPF